LVTSKIQTWRYHFFLKAPIDKAVELSIGKSKLVIKPISTQDSKGYYEFSFRDRLLDPLTAKQIAKKDFEYFKKINEIKNYLSVYPQWKRLVPLSSKKFQGKKYTYQKVRTRLRTMLTIKPPKYSEQNLQSFESIFNKIEKSSHRKAIKTSIDWLTKDYHDSLDHFLKRWISFNVLYGAVAPTATTDKQAIEIFALHGVDKKKRQQLMGKNESLVDELIKAKLIAEPSKVNYSKKLKEAKRNQNPDEIWKYSLLCIYVIRSDLFHKGHESQLISWCGSFLDSIIKLGILKIIY